MNDETIQELNFIKKHWKFITSFIGIAFWLITFYIKINTMAVNQQSLIIDVRNIKTTLIKQGFLEDFGLVYDDIPEEPPPEEKRMALKELLVTSGKRYIGE